MLSLGALPPFVLDQIIGTRDTSYVVIKLWLCGNRKLHTKLSEGLTVLELKGHPHGTFCFPKLIKHLRSLRRFAISGGGSLIHDGDSHTSLIKSLPPTLGLLNITAEKDWTKLIWNHGMVTQYPRGPSETIDLETLFPRLHTLKMSGDETQFITSDVFPALPSSLVSLHAQIRLSSSDTVLMSALPPKLRKITMPITWTFEYTDNDASFESLRRNFSSAPPSLQIMNFAPKGLSWATQRRIDTGSYEFLLPNSLLAVDDWSRTSPFWCPSLARSMPSMLQSLTLCNINTSSFRDTNWIADLPRTLTNLIVQPDSISILPFTPYVSFLPPRLVTLRLISLTASRDSFGSWSALTKNDWPSTLTELYASVWLEPQTLAQLPDTLQLLNLKLAVDELSLDSKLFPSGLTDLTLECGSEVDYTSAFAQISLKYCHLQAEFGESVHCPDWYKIFPKTIENLELEGFDLGSPSNSDTMVDLPNLTSLIVYSLHYRWFELLPRQLYQLETKVLEVSNPDVYEANEDQPDELGGRLFQHLPPSLVILCIEEIPFYRRPLSPQPLGHLSSLRFLQIDLDISSKQLRMLPRSLKHLLAPVKNLDLDDLPFLPERLQTCFRGSESPQMLERVPFSCLARMRCYTGEMTKVAKDRVLHASKHP